MAVAGGSWVGVVVVVPALAVGDQGHEPVVAATLPSCVALVAPEMGRGVHRPGDVPDQDRSHENAPDQQAGPESGGCGDGFTCQQAGREAAEEERCPGTEQYCRI